MRINRPKLRYYFILILPFFLASIVMRFCDGAWGFLQKYLLVASLTSYLTGKFINYLLRKRPKEKWNEIVGIGAICTNEIVLGNVLLVYPNYLTLFYSCNVLGSLILGIGVDSIKRAGMLRFSLIALALFSFISADPQLFTHIIPLPILSLSLVMLALFGNTSIIGRTILLDTHIQTNASNSTDFAMSSLLCERSFSSVWMCIGAISYTFHFQVKYFLLVGAIASLVFIALSRYVIEPSRLNASHFGAKEIFRKIKEVCLLGKRFFLFLLCVLLLELGFFVVFFNLGTITTLPLTTRLEYFLYASISMYCGCLLHQGKGFKNLEERGMMLAGIFISILGCIAYLTTHIQILRAISFTIVGFGSGVFLPCFYSINISFKGPHFYGLLIGMIDLIRTLGEWLGSYIFEVHQQLLLSLFTVALFCTLFLFNHLMKDRQRG